MVAVLQGGKAIGSKCKITRFYIVSSKTTDPAIISSVMAAVRKGIVSGKGG